MFGISKEKRTILKVMAAGLLFFVTGLAALYLGWQNRSADQAMLDHGAATKAHITKHNTIYGKGDSTDHKIDFSWRDAAGKERNVENHSVNDEVWKRLVSGDALLVSEIPIKYLESDQEPRAILVWDADETLRLDLMVIYAGAGFTVFGILVLVMGQRFLRGSASRAATS